MICPHSCDLSKQKNCPGGWNEQNGCPMPEICISEPIGLDGTRCSVPCPDPFMLSIDYNDG